MGMEWTSWKVVDLKGQFHNFFNVKLEKHVPWAPLSPFPLLINEPKRVQIPGSTAEAQTSVTSAI